MADIVLWLLFDLCSFGDSLFTVIFT